MREECTFGVGCVVPGGVSSLVSGPSQYPGTAVWLGCSGFGLKKPFPSSNVQVLRGKGYERGMYVRFVGRLDGDDLASAATSGRLHAAAHGAAHHASHGSAHVAASHGHTAGHAAAHHSAGHASGHVSSHGHAAARHASRGHAAAHA